MSDKTQVKQKRLPSTAWKKGQTGNPAGCPTGSRHKVTLAVQELLDGEAEALTRKCIEEAKGGNLVALKLCLERLCPVPKDRPVRIELPPMSSPADLPAVTGAVLEAVARGDLTPSEAQALGGLIEAHRRGVETAELEQRIAKLEQTKGA